MINPALHRIVPGHHGHHPQIHSLAQEPQVAQDINSYLHTADFLSSWFYMGLRWFYMVLLLILAFHCAHIAVHSPDIFGPMTCVDVHHMVSPFYCLTLCGSQKINTDQIQEKQFKNKKQK